MSYYILDTDILSLIQQHNPIVLFRRAKAIQDGHTIGLSIVTVEEQCSGWQKRLTTAKTHAAYATASLLFSQGVTSWGSFRILPETEASRTTLHQLVKSKLNVGKNDLRIASVVLDLGAILVTHNLVDYRRIPDLKFEDWAVP